MSRYRPRSQSSSRMNQKIRPNPRYADIEPAVNTGNNLRKHLERMEEIRQYYRFRPDEIFRRITITSLVTLMLEVAKLRIQELDMFKSESVAGEEDEQEEEMDIKIDESSSLSDDRPSSSMDSDRETITSVVTNGKRIPRKKGSDSVADLLQGLEIERDRISDEAEKNSEEFERPYLILDVRDPEVFDGTGSLITAVNYPNYNLIRAFNFETKIMLYFKNREGKIIVIVDEDESLASKVATTLIQRGYDNVFMLSGGLRVAKIKFPEKLVEKNRKNFSEEDIVAIEEFLEEAITRGRSSRLSTYAPSSCSSSRASNCGRKSRSYYDLATRNSTSMSKLSSSRY